MYSLVHTEQLKIMHMTNSLLSLGVLRKYKNFYARFSSVFSENTRMEFHLHINFDNAAYTSLNINKLTVRKKIMYSLSTPFSFLFTDKF